MRRSPLRFGPRAVIGLVATPLLVTLAEAQSAATAARFVRCVDERPMACVQFQVPRGQRAAEPVDTTRERWSATLGGMPLIGPGRVRPGFDSTSRLRMLVAYDVSGSMKGAGMAYTRLALLSFLDSLRGSREQIAVVPFESRQVAPRFAGATFGDAVAAGEALRALPPPTTGNTALYSAIEEGLRALDRGAGAADQGVLLVLTDGRNDVGRAGDDPSLLAGEAGRERARRLIAGTRHRVWLIGVGEGVDAGELRALASGRGNSEVVSMDAGALLALLTRIRLDMATGYALVYGIPSSAMDRLGRRPLALRVRGGTTPADWWRPPLLAAPRVSGRADSALVSADVRLLALSGVGGATRLPVGIALLSVLIAGYAVLWRLSAERGAVAPAPATRDGGAKGKPTDGAPGGLRPGVREAPPRSPDDITNDAAE